MENTQKIKDETSVQIKNSLSEKLSNDNDIVFKIVQNGDVRRLKELSLDRIIEKEKDALGNSLLHQAVRYPNMEMIRILISTGSDINAVNNMGETPLHIAAKFNNAEAVKELLKRGAQVDAKENNQLTPLHVAAEHADVTVLRLLIAHGANVQARDKWGTTPLFRVTTAANASELIHVGGADVNAQDILGNTPLYYAAWRDGGQSEVVGTLCFYGADPELKNHRGFSALDIAKEENHTELIEKMQHYVLADVLKLLAGQIEQKSQNIQKILERVSLQQTVNNELQYNMVRSLIRLKSVELCLKRIEFQEEQKKKIMPEEPQIISNQKKAIMKQNERIREN